MTIEEFDATGFRADMWVEYIGNKRYLNKGQKYYVIAVSFPEALLALVERDEDTPPDEWSWVRCENVTLVK